MKRLFTALVLIAGILAALWYLPVVWFRGIVLVVVGLSLAEFSGLFFDDAVEATAVVASGLALAFALLFTDDSSFAMTLVVSAVLFFLALFFMWRAIELPGVAEKLGLATFGVIYIGLTLPFWGWLREWDQGAAWVLMGLAPACLADTLAFVVGKMWGRHPFAPLVSPHKTWEGFVAALVGSLVGTFALWFLFFHETFSPLHAIVIAVAIWIIAPSGDLIESMLKRSIGVKDSGRLIPGHGGLLDRLDALIFAAPFVYGYARFVIGVSG